VEPEVFAAPAEGLGTAALHVTPQVPDCGFWTPVPTVDWITVLNDSPTTGPAVVLYAVAPNPGVARLGRIEVGDAVHRVEQAGAITPPMIELVQPVVAATAGGASMSTPIARISDAEDTPDALQFALIGDATALLLSTEFEPTSGTITLHLLAGCEAAPGDRSFVLRVADTDDLVTTASLVLSILPNTPPILGAYPDVEAIQSEVIVVTPEALPADPTGAPLIALSIEPMELPGGGSASIEPTSGTVTILTTLETEPGVIPFVVTAIDGCGEVSTTAFTLTLRSCRVLALTPPARSILSTGALGVSIVVTLPAPGCPWQAESSADWVTITSATSGNGNATISYNVAANSGSARSAQIVVGSGVHTVNQAAAPPPPPAPELRLSQGSTIIPVGGSFHYGNYTQNSPGAIIRSQLLSGDPCTPGQEFIVRLNVAENTSDFVPRNFWLRVAWPTDRLEFVRATAGQVGSITLGGIRAEGGGLSSRVVASSLFTGNPTNKTPRLVDLTFRSRPGDAGTTATVGLRLDPPNTLLLGGPPNTTQTSTAIPACLDDAATARPGLCTAPTSEPIPSANTGAECLPRAGFRFTVRNEGSAPLVTSDLVVPSGYLITQPLAPSIAIGSAESFVLALSTEQVGSFGGIVSFANSDPDRNPFTFSVSGSVSAPPPAPTPSPTPIPSPSPSPTPAGQRWTVSSAARR
jgi:hypothetical protein